MAEYTGRRGLLQQQHDHYMEEPDLDVSSIVTEFAPLEDPFVPYFDVPEEEMENEALNAPLDCSYVSDAGDDMGAYHRFRPAGGYAPNTSTPRFNNSSSYQHHYQSYASSANSRQYRSPAPPAAASPARSASGASSASVAAEHIETARAVASPQRDAIAEVMGDLQPELLVDDFSARLIEVSLVDQFLHSISQMVADPVFARSIKCFRSKIPKEVSEMALVSYLTHSLRWPMRRPLMTLLQARVTPTVVEQMLKTALDAPSEAYDEGMARDASYFRITLKNSVSSLGHLHEMIRAVSKANRGLIQVTFSSVKGQQAFIGYNGNLPVPMVEPPLSFIEHEEEARQQLRGHFMAEINLARVDDDRREVVVHYSDYLVTETKTGKTSRTTEVNLYHIIRPSRSSSRVSFASPSAPIKTHEFHVTGPMMSLAMMKDPTYTLAECLNLARSYPQHNW